jgi:hypothetical protein
MLNNNSIAVLILHIKNAYGINYYTLLLGEMGDFVGKREDEPPLNGAAFMNTMETNNRE